MEEEYDKLQPEVQNIQSSSYEIIPVEEFDSFDFDTEEEYSNVSRSSRSKREKDYDLNVYFSSCKMTFDM